MSNELLQHGPAFTFCHNAQEVTCSIFVNDAHIVQFKDSVIIALAEFMRYFEIGFVGLIVLQTIFKARLR